ncbi:MAG: HAMP domain-containing histidine kinase [Alphaproteobacteria bacterium]|nr:HAMP domain-containing histidine kinase [Alphaproteobacteria bacterium]
MPAKSLLPPLVHSLSARLLVLTVLFVMLVEVFVYAPSIARYRKVYLDERIADAHLATLALEAAPDFMVGQRLRAQLLDHARAYGVVTMKPGSRKLTLLRDMPPKVDLKIDLRQETFFGLIMDAFETLWQSRNRVLSVLGPSPKDKGTLIEVVLDEEPLRREMLGYSRRILVLSLIISFVTAVLVYLSLQWLLVRPMRRLTENMTAFSLAPEDATRLMSPSARGDEIGVAERQLEAMQRGLRDALRQKTRLAALGTAVTKINHDLRNLLSTASLLSERLEGAKDPKVREVAPRLESALDRAVILCTDTLDFAKSEAVDPKPAPVDLRTLVEDVASTLPVKENGGGANLDIAVTPGLAALADRTHLFRALANLGTNAVQAGSAHVKISAASVGGRVHIDVSDDGPGLPRSAREHLFAPFEGSGRSGGSGLGLAIARELAQAQGGDLSLVESSDGGTTFRLELPAA